MSRVNLLGATTTTIVRKNPVCKEDRFGGYVPRAFAATSSEKLVITSYVRNGEGVSEGQLLVQYTASSAPRQIAVEKEGRLETVQWSPEGNHVAYLTTPLSKLAEDSPKKLVVVVSQDGKKTAISNDAAALRWSADGNTLYFFQRESGKWKAYRATGWKGSAAPVTAALTAESFPSPGAFTKNGERFAVLDNEKIKVVMADGKPVSEFLLPQEMNMRSLKWSPDERWLMAQTNEASTHEGLLRTFLLEPATGRLTNLEEDLSATSSFAPTPDKLSVRAAEWLPGEGHRILSYIFLSPLGNQSGQSVTSGSDILLSTQERNAKWIVYSVDGGFEHRVEGLDPPDARANNADYLSFSDRAPQIIASPDGRCILINGRSYQVDVN